MIATVKRDSEKTIGNKGMTIKMMIGTRPITHFIGITGIEDTKEWIIEKWYGLIIITAILHNEWNGSILPPQLLLA